MKLEDVTDVIIQMPRHTDVVITNYHVNKREKLIQNFVIINGFSLQ